MCQFPIKNTPLFAVALSLFFLVGCHAETLFWKDAAQKEALSFLLRHGVTARRLVVNNAGGFELDLRGSAITNLNILEGMPIEVLLMSGTSVRDLSPLREMRYLTKLDVADTAVSDLRPLMKLQLQELNITKTKVDDLTFISGMPLRVLSFMQTEVHDLEPLRSLPLQEVYFSAEIPYANKSIRLLRDKDSLRCLNYYGRVDEFWTDFDAGKFTIGAEGARTVEEGIGKGIGVKSSHFTNQTMTVPSD